MQSINLPLRFKFIFESAKQAIIKNIVLIFLIGNSLFCIAQVKSHDDVLYETVVKTAGTDINKAMQLADSLNRLSVQPLHKIKSLMLLAELKAGTGKKKEALDYAFEAEQITFDNNLYEWQARIYGFIATHYRSLGLKKQSKAYLTKGLEAIGNVEDKHIVNQYKGLVYQEFALYEIENKNYHLAIEYLRKAEPCFKYIRNIELRSYQFATNYGQLGRVYLNLKDTKKAIANFNKSLELLSGIKNEATIVKGFMYEGIGRALLEDKDFKRSITYLEKALEIAKKSNDLSLIEEVYCDLAIYYMEIGNKEEFKKYNNLYQDAREKSIKVNKDSSEVVVNRLEERQKEISLKHNLIFAGLGILLVSLIIVVFVIRTKRKREYKKFQEIIKSISDLQHPGLLEIPEPVADKTIVADNQEQEKELMSKEVEQSILDKLYVFEQGSEFTNKNLNLSALSVLLETNSKYLSYVINKHKKKDFNNYINELRIIYIIKKLESSPEYLNYKISYLAEECGFSSHSKFTDKFKMVTDMSPSSFISFLQKEVKGKVA